MAIYTPKRAQRTQARLRMALAGPPNSGKTWTSLVLAQALARPPDGDRCYILVIDTERGSSQKYCDEPGMPIFDVIDLEHFSPDDYMAAITAARQGGYDVLCVDSLSHAWAGVGGILEYVDTVTTQSKSHNAYTEGWRKATPLHNKLVDMMLQFPGHLICTVRSKVKYVLQDDGRGHQTPKKVGMEWVQRDSLEYEMDIAGEMDTDNNLIITKTRCSALHGQVFAKPGPELGQQILAWLTDGAPMPEPAPTPTPAHQNGAGATNAPSSAPQSQGATKRAPESQPGHPSRPQLSRLFALKTQHQVSDESLKLKLKEYAVESTKDLSLEQYQAVWDWLQAQPPSPAPQEEDVPDHPPPPSASNQMSTVEQLAALRIFAQRYALSDDLEASLSHYPQGLPLPHYTQIKAALERRVAEAARATEPQPALGV